MLSEKVKDILKKWDSSGENIIEIMHDLQSELKYLPPPVLKEVAKELNYPESKMFHIATFFEGFSLKEIGKYLIAVCTGTSCHVKGAPQIVESIERELKIKEGETTPDKLFTLKTKACFGACGLAPAVIIGEELHGNLTQSKMIRLLKKIKKQQATEVKEVANA